MKLNTCKYFTSNSRVFIINILNGDKGLILTVIKIAEK